MFGLLKRKHILIALITIITAVALYFIMPVSVPLIAALVTALMLEPAVRLLSVRKKMKRHFAVMIIFIAFTLIIGAGALYITTNVIGQGVKLVEDFPQYITNVSEMWVHYEQSFKDTAQNLPAEMVHAITEEINSFLNMLVVNLRQYLNIENISAFLSYIPNFLVSFIVYLIALFLFMLDLPKIRSGIYRHLTEETADKVKFMTARLSHVVIGFFKAQLMVSIIIFAVSLIGLLIISPKVALIMSLIIWLVDLIPIIGSIIILAPWALYQLLAGDMVLGTKLAVLAVVLLLVRRIVEPKVMGTHMGLSPLATLIAMYLGLKLLGILGIIIGPMLLIVFKTAKDAGIIKMNFKI